MAFLTFAEAKVVAPPMWYIQICQYRNCFPSLNKKNDNDKNPKHT